MAPSSTPLTTEELAEWVRDARRRTFDLVADLNDEQVMSPYLPIINPLLWEIGHVAWFQEKWVLRDVCQQKPIRDDADALWDSIAIPHETRWHLPLPSREGTLAYMREVQDRVLEQLHRGNPSEELVYFARYTTFHEDMHTEAFTYTRQTLEHPPPRFSSADSLQEVGTGGRALPGDVEIPGGTFMLGATSDEPFVFDNEKWAHPVTAEPFRIARAPVTQSEFAAFVDDGGYTRQALWSQAGWEWREAEGATHPVYWRREPNGRWLRRHFDKWVSLESHLPIIHVNWYEAEAYCRWAGRRLPTEAEWEIAAAVEQNPSESGLSSRKRRFPWGVEPPTSAHANLDWNAMGCIDVGALPESDSAFGCRQMIGNVWEWTSSAFLPYPGFERDSYKEYSEPWFETRKVLRGGCWTTRSRMLRNTWRNFYTPDRRDVWAGFRTCALD
ncbi:MAG: selenoneine synthase SenA [Candidatus Poribacteria bacterium]|nr:selenoneine synthase SenA [Candidatus Poribacteria bacterium]